MSACWALGGWGPGLLVQAVGDLREAQTGRLLCWRSSVVATSNTPSRANTAAPATLPHRLPNGCAPPATAMSNAMARRPKMRATLIRRLWEGERVDHEGGCAAPHELALFARAIRLRTYPRPPAEMTIKAAAAAARAGLPMSVSCAGIVAIAANRATAPMIAPRVATTTATTRAARAPLRVAMRLSRSRSARTA